MANTRAAAAQAAEPKLMELQVDQEALLTEVTAAARAADNRGTQPILSHLRLEATSDGRLVIAATDLKRTLKTECPANVKVPGAIGVNAQKFLSYVKLLPKAPITLKLLANDHLQVHSGSSRTRMPGRAATEFPAMPDPATEIVRLAAPALKTLLRQSVFAVATGEDRYLLNTALLLLHVDRMGMVATDGRRLYMVETVEEDVIIDGTSKTLLPRECIIDLLAVLNSTKEQTVDFCQDDSCVYFQVGNRKLSVRKLAGQFPNYEGVVPKDNRNFTVVSTSVLLTSIQRVMEFADQKTSGIKMSLADNTLKLASSSPDTGETEDTIDVSYGFPPVTIGFNGTYLTEFLKTIGGEGQVRIALKDAQSAAIITPANMSAEFHQQYVVMPMRV